MLQTTKKQRYVAINLKAAWSAFWNRSTASGYRNYLLFSDTPRWISVGNVEELFKIYHENPVLYSVIQIKAKARANMRIKVVSEEDETPEPEGTTKAIPKKVYSLLKRPNPLQSQWEFLKQQTIFEQITGNSFIYANAPVGFRPTIDNIQTLQNIWPQFMKFKLTGKYFEATAVEEIIDSWIFEYGSYRKEFKPYEIFHRNEANTDARTDLILGSSPILPLMQPLSNISMAYESRNVLIKNRGMRAIISSARGDATGRIPLGPGEKDELQKEMRKYGTLENQDQFFLTDQPISVNPIDQDVRKLGLFEEIATDAMMVCNAYGVPEILLKLYLQGATFENQEASERRLYNGTIIPESEDFITGLNSFLGLPGTGWKLKGSFDHIPVLQENHKEKASANREKSKYLRDLFLSGGITHNEWLAQLDLPTWEGGDKRIWEFEENQIAIILGKNTNNNETN